MTSMVDVETLEKLGRAISTKAILWPLTVIMAILWPVKVIFEKRAATMEVDTFFSPAVWGSPTAKDINPITVFSAFSAFSCPHVPRFCSVDSPQTLVFLG